MRRRHAVCVELLRRVEADRDRAERMVTIAAAERAADPVEARWLIAEWARRADEATS